MIDQLIEKRGHDLGGGFEVGRVLPYRKRRMVGPFIFFDHLGPLNLEANFPKSFDVRAHPHIGLATITYLFDGALTHRDSLGFHQEIRPGEINWMIAGSGIAHSERLEYMRQNGGLMDGIQCWIALPESHEEVAPSFHHFSTSDVPEWTEGTTECRLIAGTYQGHQSPCPTYSPLFYLTCKINAEGQFTLKPDHRERALYVVRGEVVIDGERLGHGMIAVFTPGQDVEITANQPSDIMLLGGEALGKRHMFWNFVSSSRDRIEQAKADWRTGRFAPVVGDENERIELPED